VKNHELVNFKIRVVSFVEVVFFVSENRADPSLVTLVPVAGADFFVAYLSVILLSCFSWVVVSHVMKLVHVAS